MKGMVLVVLLLAIAMAEEAHCPQGSECLLLEHSECNKFYKCSYEVPVEQSCPSGLNFNLAIKACDWPANVDCGGRINLYKST